MVVGSPMESGGREFPYTRWLALGPSPNEFLRYARVNTTAAATLIWIANGFLIWNFVDTFQLATMTTESATEPLVLASPILFVATLTRQTVLVVWFVWPATTTTTTTRPRSRVKCVQICIRNPFLLVPLGTIASCVVAAPSLANRTQINQVNQTTRASGFVAIVVVGVQWSSTNPAASLVWDGRSVDCICQSAGRPIDKWQRTGYLAASLWPAKSLVGDSCHNVENPIQFASITSSSSSCHHDMELTLETWTRPLRATTHNRYWFLGSSNNPLAARLDNNNDNNTDKRNTKLPPGQHKTWRRQLEAKYCRCFCSLHQYYESFSLVYFSFTSNTTNSTPWTIWYL